MAKFRVCFEERLTKEVDVYVPDDVYDAEGSDAVIDAAIAMYQNEAVVLYPENCIASFVAVVDDRCPTDFVEI